MGTLNLKGYNSYSGCDMIASVKISSHSTLVNNVYTLGELQTLSISTHQDKRPVRAIGNINAIDYTMGQRTIAGSLVFAVFDKHFATDMFNDAKNATNLEYNTIILPDELPPFDITITFANEYGHVSRMALYGVRLIDEGQVMSVNDIYTENTYQFVATGLEPLNKEEGTGGNWHTTNTAVIDSSDNTFTSSFEKGRAIIESNNNNVGVIKEELISLTVSVDNPREDNAHGYCIFTLSPKQKSGTISITNLNSIEDIVIDIASMPEHLTYYSLYLPVGSYSAIYKNSVENKASNVVNFSVIFESKTNTYSIDHPIIEYVSHNSASFICNNSSHDSLKLINQNNKEDVIDLAVKNKKVVADNLIANTSYTAYSFNSSSGVRSSSVEFKTLKYENQIYDEFISYITNNKNILIRNIDEYYEAIETISPKDCSKNIIDALHKTDCNTNIKNELTLFACKLQNDLSYYNNRFSSIKQPSKDISNPYSNTINYDSTAKYSNIFKVLDKKSIFDSKVNTSKHTYVGRENLRYSTFSVKDSCRGPKYDFYNFNDESKDYLSIYNYCNVLKNINNSKYKLQYPNITSRNLDNLIAYSNKKTNNIYLGSPTVDIDENLTLNIDLEYEDIISNSDDKTYYLCISNIVECLDHTPFRKISFKFKEKSLSLNPFSTGLHSNESYIVWIEDEDYNQISLPTVFNTDVNNPLLQAEFEDIFHDIKSKKIKTILAKMQNKIALKEEEKNAFLSTESNYLIAYKDIYKDILYNLLCNPLTKNNIDYTAYTLKQVEFDNEYLVDEELFTKVVFNKNVINFESNSNYDLVKIDINILENTIDYTTSNVSSIQLSNDTGFTIVYGIKENKLIKSGFVLIDNKTKLIKPYKLKVEVIK